MRAQPMPALSKEELRAESRKGQAMPEYGGLTRATGVTAGNPGSFTPAGAQRFRPTCGAHKA